MANVKFVLDADEAKAVQGFLKVVDSQRKAERQFDRVNKKITKQNKKQKSLADVSVSSVFKIAGGWFSVGAAISAASALLAKHNQLNDKAANRARSSEFSLGSLSQLAGGSPEEMKRMVGDAKKTSTSAGIDLSEAGRLQFNLESFGIADKRKMFADLVGTVDDPSALAEAAVTMQTAFGKDETGDIRQIINKGLAASSVSKTTLSQMLISMSASAPGLRQIGATDEESLSALAILSKARKSSDVAATELDALSAVMMKKGISGKGLFGGMAAIGTETGGMSDAEMLKYFGRKEALKGYQTLRQNAPDVLSAHKTIMSQDMVSNDDAVAKAISARRSIPMLAEMEKVRIAEQQSGQATMNRRGAAELSGIKTVASEIAKAENRGDAALGVAGRSTGMGIAKYVGGSDTKIKIMGEIGNVLGSIFQKILTEVTMPLHSPEKFLFGGMIDDGMGRSLGSSRFGGKGSGGAAVNSKILETLISIDNKTADKTTGNHINPNTQTE